MYRKDEIVLVDSPVIYLRYILSTDNVSAYTYDYSKQEELTKLDRVYTLSVSLFNNQFSVDDDKGAIFCAPSVVGHYVKFTYYTEGEQNPFYASSNLHAFISQILRWTANRISEGIYLTSEHCSSHNMRTIQPGSFVHENQFYAYPGGVFDVRQVSPPTLVDKFKAYYLFINNEIISDRVDKQERLLVDIGILPSSTMHDDVGSAKLDVQGRYATEYTSTPIEIAYVFVQLLSSFEYDIWIEYPPKSRTL